MFEDVSEFESEALSKMDAESDRERHKIRIVSWNIDGLDMDLDSVMMRTKTVCDIISKESPHAVFLQEVTPLTVAVIKHECPNYRVVLGGDKGYFTCMLLRLGQVEIIHDQVLPFPGTVMSRNLLLVQCEIKGESFFLMTSHLESCKENSHERIAQLRKAFRMVQKASGSTTVIFGGDLNLRNKEIASIGGPPPGVHDIWEMTGRCPETEYTWDLSRNTNKSFGDVKPKFRFDRIYIRGASTPVVEPVRFELIGLEKVEGCDKFPSDHWGLLTSFNMLSKN